MKKKLHISNNMILFVILILLIILFGVLIPDGIFFNPSVLIGTTSDIAYLGIMALPMTFIILTAGIDLSVGFLMTASAMVFSKVFTMTESLTVGIIAALAAGMLFGFLNGILVAKTKIHSWLVSLGTMYIFQSVTWFIGGSHSYAPGNALIDFGTGKIAGIIPNQLIILLICFLIFELLDTKSTLGRYLHAIGHNESAVIYSGVNAKMIQCLIFVMMGVMCALAGLMFLGKSWEVNQTTGLNMNIEVITLVVLGGTSVAGGVGSVRGTFIATLIIGVLKKGLALMGMSGDVYNFILGAVLIVALIAFAYLEVRKRLASREMAVKNMNE
ncbi:ABC transporter permease [Mediterraneibacter agrestimuris]|uniref:ABC transporter permease n=1 Tax=Mediterraneibacter agrestimuris TaxID=2941333 RepID=UPI00204149CB|nr:ABC transporter permease [Mediterraneibacter agrestimuris]